MNEAIPDYGMVRAIADVLWFRGGAIETEVLRGLVENSASPVPFDQLLQLLKSRKAIRLENGMVFDGEKMPLEKPSWLLDGPPEWKPGDGDVSGVWNVRSPMGDKAVPGHFCLWTCKWETDPSVAFAPELLTPEQVYWTLRDIAALNLDDNISQDAGQLLIELAGEKLQGQPLQQAREICGRARVKLPVFVPPWIQKPIVNLPRRAFRPGWSWPFWVTHGGLGLVVGYTRRVFNSEIKSGVLNYG